MMRTSERDENESLDEWSSDKEDYNEEEMATKRKLKKAHKKKKKEEQNDRKNKFLLQ